MILNWLLTIAVLLGLMIVPYAIWKHARSWRQGRHRSRLDSALHRLGRSVEERNRKLAAKAGDEPPF